MTQLGGSSVSPSGVAIASVTLTAQELRTLSLNIGGHAYKQAIPGIPGKRIWVHGIHGFVLSGTVFFANGSIAIVSQSDDIGNGTSYFWGNLNGLGTPAANTDIEALGRAQLSSELNELTNVGEGIFVNPINFATVGANCVLQFDIFYQYY